MAKKSNSKKSTPVSTPSKEKKKVIEKKSSTAIPRERVIKAVNELIKFTSSHKMKIMKKEITVRKTYWKMMKKN